MSVNQTNLHKINILYAEDDETILKSLKLF